MRILKFTVIGDDLQARVSNRLTLNTVGIELQNENLIVNTECGTENCHIQIWRILSRANNEELQIRYMNGSAVVLVAINAANDPQLSKLDYWLSMVEKATATSENQKMLTYVVILARNNQNIDLKVLNEKLMDKHPHLNIKTYCSSLFHNDELEAIFQTAAEHAMRTGAGIKPLFYDDEFKKNNSTEPSDVKQTENSEDFSDVLLPVP